MAHSGDTKMKTHTIDGREAGLREITALESTAWWLTLENTSRGLLTPVESYILNQGCGKPRIFRKQTKLSKLRARWAR
jgi:hypothetical protein